MPVPDWDDPIATAHQEAAVRLARGLPVRPTLIGFEGHEPTLYVRGRLAFAGPDREVAVPELLLLPRMLGLRRMMIVSQVTMSASDPLLDAGAPPHADLSTQPGSARGSRTRAAHPAPDDVDAAVHRALFAQRAIVVDRVQRDEPGMIDGGCHVLRYRIDDRGRCCWDDPVELPDAGPWTEVVAQQFAAGERDDRPDALRPTDATYALTRFGVTIAVAPTWRARYGFDGPLDPRGVRREDRRRAQDREARRGRWTAAGVQP